jgi:hypothetical protein
VSNEDVIIYDSIRMVATMIPSYPSDQTAMLSVVRDKGPFFGGVIEKLLAKLRQDRNVPAKYGTANFNFTMVESCSGENEVEVVYFSLNEWKNVTHS